MYIQLKIVQKKDIIIYQCGETMKKNKIIKTYCENCKCEVDAYVISDKETFCVVGEDIEINTEYLKCPKCEEKIFNEELDNKTLQKGI